MSRFAPGFAPGFDTRRRAAWLLRAIAALALVALNVFAVSSVMAQDLAAVPALTARVTDGAGLLTAEQRAALESVLAEYEKEKGTQIAVLTVGTTAPEPIEQYGIRVADTWKIGRKGTADGVILIVAKDNPRDLRRLRIEVGKGVEGAITDAHSKRIIDEDIAPHFRQEDYYGGLVAGVSRIRSLLQGEALPPPPAPVAREANRGQGGFGIGIPGLLILFVIVSLLFRGGLSRRVGYLSGNRALNRSIAPMVVGGILGSLGRGGGGGFGGGGGGGFGGGGGGFSGGGGDFGGGGASGDW